MGLEWQPFFLERVVKSSSTIYKRLDLHMRSFSDHVVKYIFNLYSFLYISFLFSTTVGKIMKSFFSRETRFICDDDAMATRLNVRFHASIEYRITNHLQVSVDYGYQNTKLFGNI